MTYELLLSIIFIIGGIIYAINVGFSIEYDKEDYYYIGKMKIRKRILTAYYLLVTMIVMIVGLKIIHWLF